MEPLQRILIPPERWLIAGHSWGRDPRNRLYRYASHFIRAWFCLATPVTSNRLPRAISHRGVRLKQAAASVTQGSLQLIRSSNNLLRCRQVLYQAL